MPEIIERYRRQAVQAENPSSVKLNTKHLQQEVEIMKQKIELLVASNRKFMGLGLGSSSFDEVQHIEQKVQRTVNIIRPRKMEVFSQSMERLEEKEKVLHAENALLWEKYNGLQFQPNKVSNEERGRRDNSDIDVQSGDEKSDVETELFIGLPERRVYKRTLQ